MRRTVYRTVVGLSLIALMVGFLVWFNHQGKCESCDNQSTAMVYGKNRDLHIVCDQHAIQLLTPPKKSKK